MPVARDHKEDEAVFLHWRHKKEMGLPLLCSGSNKVLNAQHFNGRSGAAYLPYRLIEAVWTDLGLRFKSPLTWSKLLNLPTPNLIPDKREITVSIPWGLEVMHIKPLRGMCLATEKKRDGDAHH